MAIVLAEGSAAGSRAPAQVLTGQGSEDGTGHARVRFGPVPAGTAWRITLLTVVSDSGLLSEATVYEAETAELGRTVDATANGNLDLASYDPAGLIIRSGRVLLVEWAGLSAGATCHSRLQYESEAA